MTDGSSRRWASVLLALAVAIGGTGSPAAAVDDDPAAAVRALFDAVADGRSADIAALECEDQRDEAARRLDLTDVIRDVPVSARRSFLRLLDVKVSSLDTQLLEADDLRALVRVTASISVVIDEDGLTRALRSLSWSGGMVDDTVRRAVLRQRVHERLATVLEPTVVDSEVEVVHERGAWRVCGDLGWGIEVLDPADVCNLLSPGELTLLVAIPFAMRIGEGSGCTFAAADGSGHLSSVNIRLDEGTLALIRSTFPDGVATSVAGFTAHAAAGSLWVDLGGRLLTIQPTLIDAPDGADAQRLAQSIGEIIVPRIGR